MGVPGEGDLDGWIQRLRRCEVLTEAEVRSLCWKAREILIEEPNIQPVQSPVTVRAKPLHYVAIST